jgi:hypothetical protein
MRRILVGLFILFNSMAGSVKAQQQSAGWLANQTTIGVSKKWGILTGFNVRSNDKWVHFQTIGARIAVVYNIKKHVSIAGGIEQNYNRKMIGDVAGYFNDRIIWNHLLISHHIRRFNILHRLRLEERFISRLAVENGKLKKQGNNFAERLRYLFRVSHPLNSKKEFRKGGYIAFAEELMLNFGDRSFVNGRLFDQNRIYAGVGYRFSSKIDMETGYLRQYVVPRDGNTYNNNVVQLSSFLRL